MSRLKSTVRSSPIHQKSTFAGASTLRASRWRSWTTSPKARPVSPLICPELSSITGPSSAGPATRLVLRSNLVPSLSSPPVRPTLSRTVLYLMWRKIRLKLIVSRDTTGVFFSTSSWRSTTPLCTSCGPISPQHGHHSLPSVFRPAPAFSLSFMPLTLRAGPKELP